MSTKPIKTAVTLKTPGGLIIPNGTQGKIVGYQQSDGAPLVHFDGLQSVFQVGFSQITFVPSERSQPNEAN